MYTSFVTGSDDDDVLTLPVLTARFPARGHKTAYKKRLDGRKQNNQQKYLEKRLLDDTARFFRFKNSPFYASPVCEFISELPHASLVPYARLWQKHAFHDLFL